VLSRRYFKKASRRNLLLSIAALVILSILGLYLALGRPTAQPGYRVGSVVPQALYAAFNSAAQGEYGLPNSSYTLYFSRITGNPYYVGSKPVVVYIGGDFCGTCGGERWPLIMALMRFGNFTNLHLMASSLNDQFANVTSFSFFSGSYSSSYIAFASYEVWDRNAQPQQSVPTNYMTDWQNLNRTVPYLNFGNEFILRGIFSPASLEGHNWTSIVSSISSGTGVGKVIREVANGISAVVCTLDGGLPSRVCSDPAISGFILIGQGAPEGALPAAYGAHFGTYQPSVLSWKRLEVHIVAC
jgi:hypothetical protein